eukprot:Hpha_TRINITY_DN4368_c1_g1::TRINITY_DN4368_c1_g1_i1::g.50012::m.50012
MLLCFILAAGVGSTHPLDWGVTCDTTPAWAIKGACSCSTTLRGLTFTVQGWNSATDSISCTPTGALAASNEPATGKTTISGTGTLQEYSAMLSGGCVFTTTDTSGGSRTLTYSLLPSGMFDIPSSAHYYEYFAKDATNVGLSAPNCPNRVASQDRCYFDDAVTECEDQSRELLGLVGYLVTITTADERNAIGNNGGWVGAADVEQKGEWFWVTGPEGCPKTTPPGSSCNYAGGEKGTWMSTERRSGFWNRAPYSNFDYAGGVPQMWNRADGDQYRVAIDKGGDKKYNDYFADSTGNGGTRVVNGYHCEWGGVGELCIDAGMLTGDLVLQFTPTAPPSAPPA